MRSRSWVGEPGRAVQTVRCWSGSGSVLAEGVPVQDEFADDRMVEGLGSHGAGGDVVFAPPAGEVLVGHYSEPLPD